MHGIALERKEWRGGCMARVGEQCGGRCRRGKQRNTQGRHKAGGTGVANGGALQGEWKIH